MDDQFRIQMITMNSRSGSQRILWSLLGVAIFVTYSGMLLEHGKRLWSHDYFSFFPVFLIAVIAVTADRFKTSKRPKQGKWRVDPISFGVSILLLGGSVWFQSPLVGAVSFLLLIDSLLCHMREARSSWRLLLLLIPLPFGIDGQVIHKLQLESSVRASQILDAINVPHLMQGNVLELPDRRYFVEEACSGISSIYLMMAATALYVVMSRMRFVRAIPLMLSVLWWAMVANAVRIVAIAYCHHFHQLELSAGWKHEILGISTMILAFVGIWSTRALLDFLLGPITESSENPDASSFSLIKLWDRFTAPFLHGQKPIRGISYSMEVSQRRMLISVTTLMIVAATSYWGLVAKAAYLPGMSSDISSQKLTKVPLAQKRFDALNRNQFDGIQTISVAEYLNSTNEHNEPSQSDARYSKSWVAKSLAGEATFRVDGPFYEWNDARAGYLSDGWKLEQASTHRIPNGPPSEKLVTVRMIDRSGNRAHLHFCMLRPSAEMVSVPLQADATEIIGQLKDRIGGAASIADNGEMWQFQLLIRVSGQSFDATITEEHQLFSQLLRVVRKQWRDQVVPIRTNEDNSQGDSGSNELESPDSDQQDAGVAATGSPGTDEVPSQPKGLL